jgi:hypothetical protein
MMIAFIEIGFGLVLIGAVAMRTSRLRRRRSRRRV